jgi:hypothetical protein
MKSAFTAACLVVAAQAGLNTVFHDFLRSHDIPVTRADATKAFGGQKKSFKSNHANEIAVYEAQHNIQAQRTRLGLPLVGAGTDERQSYENLNGFFGRFLGFAQGLQYNPNDPSGECFGAIENLLIASDNGLSILTKIWMPWYLSEAQLILQDTIALQAGFYSRCDVDKFFASMT